MPGSWTVVKFIEENSVEAVPTSWIKDNKHCLWPSLQYNKVIQAIRNNQEPDIDWPLYEITIFRNSTYGNYMTARNKCKKAEDTSDLNSEVSGGDTKRKIKRKIHSSSEEEHEEFSYRFLPTPPPLKDNNVTRKNNDIGQEVVRTHDTKSSIFAQSNPIESESDYQSSQSLIVRKTNRTYDNNKARKSYISNPDLAIHDDNFFQDNCDNSGRENFQLTNSTKCACKLCPTHFEMHNKNEKYFQEIIRQQNYFKAQLWQTCEDIRDLKNTGLNQTNGIQRQESIFYSFTLPIETEQQLEEVEQFLKNQANFETSVTQASRTGGKHSYEFIKRNLNQLLSNKLAEKYSWYGKKQKKKFHKLKLAEMLIAAGEACVSFTKKDIEESIQKWLRRAKERADAHEKKLTNRELNS